jgi:hypothetical protein
MVDPVNTDCPYGGPVVSLDELDALDSAEMVEGYHDGYQNEPRPSGNRSKSYWHGWRNGMMDGKLMPVDASAMVLVRAVVARNRATPTKRNEP